MKSLYCAANKLIRTFDQCSPAVNTLFRAYCMPMHACQLWSKYTQTRTKRFRVAQNNACWITHYIPRNGSVRPHQVNHYVRTFDALFRNDLYVLLSDVNLHHIVLADHFKGLMLFLNFHIFSINARVVRRPIAVVAGALSLFCFSFVLPLRSKLNLSYALWRFTFFAFSCDSSITPALSTMCASQIRKKVSL